MKRIIIFAVFAVISLCSYAQFVLTPSAGLMTEDGPYVISRDGTEVENYEAVKKAIDKVIPNGEVGEVEYEKSFNVSSAFKGHGKLPGALVATDREIRYTLFIDCYEGRIQISFKELDAMKVTKNDELLFNIYPTIGKNSMSNQLSGIQYVFNSKGKVASGGKKIKVMFEDYANELVKQIESYLK